jgi:regulator of protease activity HflC (stomatin/prohibitin superfamily)
MRDQLQEGVAEFGITVDRVEIRQVGLPQDMQVKHHLA